MDEPNSPFSKLARRGFGMLRLVRVVLTGDPTKSQRATRLRAVAVVLRSKTCPKWLSEADQEEAGKDQQRSQDVLHAEALAPKQGIGDHTERNRKRKPQSGS